MNHRAKAFTLVELLVVVTIIAILVTMLFPSVSAAFSLAQEKTCNANLSVSSWILKAACSDTGRPLLTIRSTSTSCVVHLDKCSKPASLSITT